MGLFAACTLLISTLTILYQGSREGAAGAPRATDGVRLVIGDGGDAGLNRSAPPANLAAATTH